jgi:hypothetical protein
MQAAMPVNTQEENIRTYTVGWISRLVLREKKMGGRKPLFGMWVVTLSMERRR